MPARVNAVLSPIDLALAAESRSAEPLSLTGTQETAWHLTLHALRVARCAAFVKDEEGRWMVLEARRPQYPSGRGSGVQLSLRYVTASDLQALPWLEDQLDGEEFGDFGVGSEELVVPLLSGNQWYGFLQVSEQTVSRRFSEHDLTTLRLVACHVLSWLRDSLGPSADDHSAAHIDYLTNVYNYRYFCRRLKRELLQAELLDQPLSLLMIDLDGYKQINDTYGHQIGNAVLVQIASLFQLAVRETDVVCRYGGDEFVVILPHSDNEEALNLAHGLEGELRSKQVKIPGAGLISIPSLTIGVSTFPTPASSGEELIRQADQALYLARGGLPGLRHSFGDEGASELAP